MNAVKPPVSSCRSRMRRRCSMRSAGVSSEPNIIVAVVFMPRPWATRITSSHVSVGILCGLMAVRTLSTRISAPPPGKLSRPAARRRRSVSSMLRSLVVAMWTISGGESERLLDLTVDVLLGEQIALAAPRLLVEGAEAAAREAVVGVVDVAIDDERDLVAGVEAATDGVGARADAQQVAAFEQGEGLGVAEAACGRGADAAHGRSSTSGGASPRRSSKRTRWSPCGPWSVVTGRPSTSASPGRIEKPSAVWNATEPLLTGAVTARTIVRPSARASAMKRR